MRQQRNNTKNCKILRLSCSVQQAQALYHHLLNRSYREYFKKSAIDTKCFQKNCQTSTDKLHVNQNIHMIMWWGKTKVYRTQSSLFLWKLERTK